MSVKNFQLSENSSVFDHKACTIISYPNTNFTSIASSSIVSVREPQTKDEYRITEIEKEIHSLESVCKSMCADLEHSPLTTRYVVEIQRVWDLLVKSHNNSKRMADVIKEQLQALSNNNMKLTVAHEHSKSEQKTIDNLTQEVKRALRMVDTAHTREQVAQETIENLRQQINRLHSELESKSRMSDHDGEFSSMAKTKEAQAKERERMMAEISNLRERLNAAMTYQDELERKNSSADLRISELQQELENQTNEMSKESRFKERFEDELLRVKKELTVKDSQIVTLNEQIQELQMKMIHHQNANKELRVLNDKNGQTIEVMNQRLVKSQEDYQREVGLVEELRQTITVLNNQVKANEDEIAKLLSEVAKTSTIQEMFKKKISKIEGQKSELEEQKAKLVMSLQTLQRTIREEQNKGKDDKMLLESTIRERDIVNRNLLKVNALVSEKEQVIKLINQAKLYLEHDIDNTRLELSRQSQHIAALEKEKDRHVADAVVLTKKLEAAIDDTKLQQVAVNDYKKKLTQSEGKLANKASECENLRFELNTCTKNLNEAQEDILEFKHKSKVMTLQLEQLKEDIAGKEMQLIREQLALRKAHAEKEAMRIETQKVEAELREIKQVVSNLEMEVNSLQHSGREAYAQHHRDLKEIDQLRGAREAINAQLVRRNDELAVLREKTKTLQSSLDAGQKQYSQRLEDIRVLKLEIQRLRQ
ncbi:cilia- and flagella-associated protein 58-like [Macrosteles quadrilineatus]|uniref:cilia- and flagella-associated protein 58-like n=1 Tax=Macrosteles quadrilineatus TaxID=74068 RepID=UPI0023E34236|nr:cilia- and flagella-associated protein 58-like [Macrosteles quadrilineatus]